MKQNCDILSIGQVKNNSGFSRVFENLLPQLSKFYSITHFGINYTGPTIKGDWIIEPAEASDHLGVDTLRNIIIRYKPQIIFICYDFWLLGMYYSLIKELGYLNKTIYYLPVEFDISNIINRN